MLYVLHRQAQGEDDQMHGIQLEEDYCREDTPQQRGLNYVIKEYRRSEKTGKRCAGFDAERTVKLCPGFDAKITAHLNSKRVRMGACEENMTGELIDSIARRLSAMST